MASKKVQATLEEQLLIEMEKQMTKEKFYETSEFVKHCIRQYLITKAPGGIPSIMRMSGSPVATEYNLVSTESLLK